MANLESVKLSMNLFSTLTLDDDFWMLPLSSKKQLQIICQENHVTQWQMRSGQITASSSWLNTCFLLSWISSNKPQRAMKSMDSAGFIQGLHSSEKLCPGCIIICSLMGLLLNMAHFLIEILATLVKQCNSWVQGSRIQIGGHHISQNNRIKIRQSLSIFRCFSG